jgi:hypothetical protein
MRYKSYLRCDPDEESSPYYESLAYPLLASCANCNWAGVSRRIQRTTANTIENAALLLRGVCEISGEPSVVQYGYCHRQKRRRICGGDVHPQEEAF